MFRTFKLHGSLKPDGQSEFKIFASTIADGIKILSAQIKTLQGKIGIAVVGAKDISFLFGKNDREVIDLVPALAFGKDGGIVKIIIGAALVVGSFFIDPSGTTGLMIANAMFATGVSLVIGGVMQIIAPTPDFNSSDGERSRYLGNIQNTVAIGTMRPVLLGRFDIGGHLLSNNIDAAERR
jgi:predicted phage tail protein